MLMNFHPELSSSCNWSLGTSYPRCQLIMTMTSPNHAPWATNEPNEPAVICAVLCNQHLLMLICSYWTNTPTSKPTKLPHHTSQQSTGTWDQIKKNRTHQPPSANWVTSSFHSGGSTPQICTDYTTIITCAVTTCAALIGPPWSSANVISSAINTSSLSGMLFGQ